MFDSGISYSLQHDPGQDNDDKKPFIYLERNISILANFTPYLELG